MPITSFGPEPMGASFGGGAPAGLSAGSTIGNVGTSIASGAMAGGPVGAALGGVSSLGKAAKGGGKGGGPDPIINAISGGASTVLNPVTQQILADPLSFQKRLGLSVLSGGLGAIGDILKENAVGGQARRLKQTPANTNESAWAAGSRGQIAPMSTPNPNTQRLQALQARTDNLIAQSGSPQLKASRFGVGGF